MNGVRRGKGARTTVPAKDCRRAGICWTVTSPHRHPTSVGSRTSPTAGPGPVRLRHLRRRRVRPADRGLACRHHQGHRPGLDTTVDRVLGPGPAKGSRSSRVSCCTTPMRVAVHIHPVHQHLELEGIAPSIGTVGDAHDNALMESIIGLFKTEAIATTVFHDGPYGPSRRRVRRCRLGRLVQPQTPARVPRLAHPGRVRAGPLRCPQPRAGRWAVVDPAGFEGRVAEEFAGAALMTLRLKSATIRLTRFRRGFVHAALVDSLRVREARSPTASARPYR